MSAPTPSAQTVRLIRLAMLGGIVIFLVIVVFLRTSESFVPDTESDLPGLLTAIAAGLQLASLAAIFLVRGRLSGTTEPAARFNLILVASAFAEGGALLGTVAYLLGGPAAIALSGAVIFVISLLRLPFEQTA